jgi:hypothetical protein
MRRLMSGAVVALAFAWTAACAPKPEMAATEPAPEPPPPAAVDPVGTYTFSTIYMGDPLTGKIVIRGEPDRYTGTVIPASGPEPVEIYAVTVDGQTVTVFGDAGGDDLIITMKFIGDTYTGSWTLGFEGDDISGSRVKDAP